MSKLRRNPAATEPMQLPKPYIATPAYGGQLLMGYLAGLRSLARTLDAAKIPHLIDITGNESLVTRARNNLVAHFLESDCTHLMFIDADIGFSANDVAKLVYADLDVCGGAYPMKAIGWGNVAAAVKEGQPVADLAKLGGLYAVTPKIADAEGTVTIEKHGPPHACSRFIEVDDLATGFMCIRRNVLERFIARYRADIEYTPDDIGGVAPGAVRWNVFHADRDPQQVKDGVKAPRYLSEDYHFCRRWQMMGGKTYVCLDIQLSHTGTHKFEGDIGILVDDDEAEAAPVPPTNGHAQSHVMTGDEVASMLGGD